MKKLVSLLSFLLVMSCVVEEGVDGRDGRDGGLIVADVISVSNANFNAPNFEIIVDFEPIYSDEVILVYRRWSNNTWRLLPQTVFFENGNELDYNFDFTQNDVSIFLDSTLDLNTLGAEWIQNQTFRIVIIPASQINGVDISDINTVMAIGNIEAF